MLFVRWKKAFRNRYAGTDCKIPIGAGAGNRLATLASQASK